MVLANLVFDDEYESSDTLLVQDEFFNDELKNMTEFNHWAQDEKNGCFIWFKGIWTCDVNAEEFVRWLNRKFMTSKENEAQIIKKHTKYDPKLPIIEL